MDAIKSLIRKIEKAVPPADTAQLNKQRLELLMKLNDWLLSYQTYTTMPGIAGSNKSIQTAIGDNNTQIIK